MLSECFKSFGKNPEVFGLEQRRKLISSCGKTRVWPVAYILSSAVTSRILQQLDDIIGDLSHYDRLDFRNNIANELELTYLSLSADTINLL